MTKHIKTMVRSRKRAPKTSVYDPPAYNAAPVVNNSFRFLSSGSTQTTVTLQQLLAVCGMVTTVANTQTTKIADTVKINSIRIWSPATVGAKIQLSWLAIASVFTRPVEASDICTSTSRPAVLNVKPPPNELYSDWMSASSTSSDLTICRIVAPANSIIDINLTYQTWTGSGGSTASTLSLTSGSAALGSIYYGYLDTNATHLYLPVDLPSTY